LFQSKPDSFACQPTGRGANDGGAGVAFSGLIVVAVVVLIVVFALVDEWSVVVVVTAG